MDDIAARDRTGAWGHWSARVQAGCLGGLLATIFAVSHATLVSGSAAPEATSTLVGMSLLGTGLLCLLLSLFSRLESVVAIFQDVPAAALGALLLAVVAGGAAAGRAVTVAEIVVLCALTGLVFGLAVFLFGALRLSILVRFAPRPVLAGFLAGTGYFVVIGALGICLGAGLRWETLPVLFDPPALYKVLVALAVTLGLTLTARLMRPSAAIAITIGGALVLFFLVIALSGTGTDRLRELGWTVVLPAGGMRWPPVTLGELRTVDRGFVLSQLLPIGTVVVLAVTALVMSITALEARARSDVDLDRELRALGLANLAVTALGGLFGYHGVSTSLAARRAAPPHGTVSAVAGAFVLLVFVLGDVILAVLPLPILAGFMLWVGVDLLRDWLWREVRTTPVSEAWLTLAIFGVIVAFGLFAGTVFGLVAGAALFVFDYSRLDPVRDEMTGALYHGATEWGPEELAALREHGDEIAILKLQGFLFFGLAHRMRGRVQRLLASRSVRFLILDFHHVSGLDATAVESFRRLADDLEAGDVAVTLTGLNERVAGVFRRAGFEIGPGARFGAAPDLDSGLAEAEARLIARVLGSEAGAATEIETVLAEILGAADLAAELRGYLERVTLAAGDVLIAEGDAACDIFILESGGAQVIVGAGATAARVRDLKPGAVIGEIAYLTGGRRSSTVVATEASVVWRFSSETAARVLRDAPGMSSRFHAGLARILAERVDANTRLIRMLQS